MSLSPQEVRSSKVDLFSERSTLDEVLQYAHSGLPQEYRAFATTAIMLYHNTLLELIAQLMETSNERE